MIEYNEILESDKQEIENFWIRYWRDRNLSYDINFLKLDRMETCFIFRNDGEFCMMSGIDDISEFIPNTIRILTRATTTHYKPKTWGKYIEEIFFTNVVAGISVNWCLENHPSKDIVITTNEDSRITKVLRKYDRNWMTERGIEKVYGVEQVIWDINYENCINMTNQWKNKNEINKL